MNQEQENIARKEEKEVVGKAANMIGTYFVILLAIIYFLGNFLLDALKDSPDALRLVVYAVLQIGLPIAGAFIIEKLAITKLAAKVTSATYPKVRKMVIQQLSIIIVLDVLVNISNILGLVCILIGDACAAFYILKSLEKHCNQNVQSQNPNVM